MRRLFLLTHLDALDEAFAGPDHGLARQHDADIARSLLRQLRSHVERSVVSPRPGMGLVHADIAQARTQGDAEGRLLPVARNMV